MKPSLSIEEKGKVVGVFGSIIKIKGLPFVKMEEVVDIGGKRAIIFKFHREFTSNLIYEDFCFGLSLEQTSSIKPGEEVVRTGEVFKIPVGESLLGRVIDPLCRDIETKKLIKGKSFKRIETFPPEIMERGEVKEFLETGIKIIDGLFPIGKGQRELIVGDRKTGKTTLGLDIILNQKKEVLCIFVGIGKKRSEMIEIVERLRKKGKLSSSLVVATFSSDSPVLQYLAPFSAMTIAEYFRDKGRDVLVVFDDLTKHAWSWREISLLLERPPGREAYPGDIFYLHARLLERAGRLKEELGGGSITVFPICETKEGDISEYIPTNLISITDGQLYLENSLFQKGFIPAINIGLSVSRIGGKAQPEILREVAKELKLLLSQHSELKKLAQLETTLSKKSQIIFKRGEILLEILKQEKHELVDFVDQSILYFLILEGLLDDVKFEHLKNFEIKFLEFLNTFYQSLKKELLKKGWTKEIKEKIKHLTYKVKSME